MHGPVFHRELSATARSPRAFALRSSYVLALLAVASATAAHARGAGLDPGPTGGAVLAGRVFRNLVLAQAGAVFLLTPALVAGAVAVEAQRKTLHDLLTSDLTAAEVVLGKLAARLLHVGVLVAAGLPVLLAAGLLGGVDPRLVALAVAATLTMSFFLGGLSVLASTQAGTVRGALNLVFTLALTWLILPAAAGVQLPRSGPVARGLYDRVAPVNAWLASSSPFALLLESLAAPPVGADLVGRVALMAGLQVAGGATLAALAVARLRPAYAARQGGPSRPPSGRSRARWRAPCGDDPMAWKELAVAPAPTLRRHLGLAVGLGLVGVLAWGAADFALPAFREVLVSGYGVAPAGSARGLFHLYLRVVATGVSLAFLLGIASDAAAGVTTERERDTWVSLTATPLTVREVVRAKMLGAVWGVRHAAALLALLGLAGALAGSLHPAGLVAVAGVLAASAAFAAALGTWVSLRAADTPRAVAATLGCLLLANAGPALVLAALWPARPLALAGCAPAVLALALASPGEVLGRPTASALAGFTDATAGAVWSTHGSEVWLACLAGVAACSTGAWALARSACRGYDARPDRRPVAARPTRLRQAPSRVNQREPAATTRHSPLPLGAVESVGADGCEPRAVVGAPLVATDPV